MDQISTSTCDTVSTSRIQANLMQSFYFCPDTSKTLDENQESFKEMG